MDTNEKLVSELNKLVEINNDRVDGYETAAKETEDSALKSLFNDFASDSRSYRDQLSGEVIRLGGTPEKGTSVSGKFYRAWMDVKAALTAKNRKQIVASCEFGEDVAKDSYNDALNGNVPWTSETRMLVERQRDEILSAHNRIKELRDTVKA